MYNFFKYIIIILFVLLYLNQEVRSQYVFRHIDITDGLSDNQIRNITETPDGRIAIRMLSSLNIYNGGSFDYFYIDRKQDYKWSFTRFFKEYYDNERRLWMKSPGTLSLFDLKTNSFVRNIDDELKSMDINERLKNLFIDEDKNFWFLMEDNSFLFYDIKKKELKTIDTGNNPLTKQYGIPTELVQYKNLYWIIYSSGLLRCWDSTTQEFTVQDTQFMGKITELTDRIFICPTSTGDLWLMSNNIIFYYDRTSKVSKEIATIKGASNFFTCMNVDMEGNVWIGTSWSGLRRIDGQTHEVEIIPRLKLTNSGVLYNDIQSVYIDSNNGLWVGTLWQGICYYHSGMQKFKLLHTTDNETLTTNESVRCFLEGEDGNILVGTGTNGLCLYDPATGLVKKAFNGMIDDLCMSLYRDTKNRIWVGTFLNGFYCIDGKKITNYNKSDVNLEIYPTKNASRAIYEDAKGRYWASVIDGVGELNLQTGKINLLRDRHPEIGFHTVDYNIYPVNDITFAVYGQNGIYYYDTEKDKVYIPEIDDPENIKFKGSSTAYYHIFKDSRSLEWFSTEHGIRIWDEKRQKLYTIDSDDGLPNNLVSATLEDNQGIYWVSTANGITKIQINDLNGGEYIFSLVNFDSHDGLQSGKFYEGSALKAKNGDLYFGGIHGFNTFSPDKISYNLNKNKPIFTGLRLFNSVIKEKSEYNGHVILKNPINNTKEIKLNYRENSITLEFSGLNYVNPSRTYFKYKLENYDKEWTNLSTTGLGATSYTGLAPGEYKLIVYTANNDKIWGDEAAEVTIIITPPFWATTYAYLIYLLFIVGVLTWLFFYLNKKQKLRLAEQQLNEKRKQKENLDQMKFRFFTNISHEFRTPLTLIMTPLSILIKQIKDEQVKEKLLTIYRSAESMLGLINQLLDFRKLEMGGEKLKLSLDDFIKFSEYVHVTFRELAADKSIDFRFESEVRQLYIWFDKEKIRKIFNNLYSNALKFTPENGSITTEINLKEENGREFIKVVIADTGCGIPEKELQTIFGRFYQSENNTLEKAGSGIGLHLVKEYVELHEGVITVNSKVNEGSVFTISIPTDLKGKEITESDSQISEGITDQQDKDRKTILIVEDNSEFRHFLAEQLSSQFNIIEASDGEEGENIARKKYPDLIISDLMMPKQDGLELCRHLKSDIQTSHISIILLTAKLSDEAKIESYKVGADSYIAKPFNFEVLETRIEMLIEQQEKRKKLFHKTIDVQPSSITTTSLDEEFIKKALQLIEMNISNPDYSNDDLSKDLGMSRSSMYPKFQSVTGQTPNHFIRSIRLKRAAQLLLSSQYTVSEISWMVGINDIKYFNKYFKEDFGKTPTQYRVENKESL